MKILLQKLNDFYYCKVKKMHKEKTESVGIWEVVYCEKCLMILSKKKVRPSFREIYLDVYFNSGNQIW